MKFKVSIFLIIIALVVGVLIFSLQENENIYSDEAINTAKEEGLKEKLEDTAYSKTLDEMLKNELFIEQYYDEYLNIDYLENEPDFLNRVNIFLTKNYNSAEINNIFSLSTSNVDKLLTIEYTNFDEFLNIQNFDIDNISRYTDYIFENENILIQDAVTKVNIGLDNPYYSNISIVSNPSDLNVLINKYNSLPENYVPDNLTIVPGFENYELVDVAANSISELILTAKSDGFNFILFSAYRSYSRQKTLYSNYKNTYGIDSADTFSARAGHSEHQTGYAVDIYNPTHYNATKVRMNDEDYKWILENSYKFGFIVRYPKDSTDITGYIEEPWHLRYLGVELATEVVNSGLTYDEYYDLNIKEY